MPRGHVLFYLVPLSPAAQVVLDDLNNAYLVDHSGLGPRFAIGNFQSQCGRPGTLVTIGRNGDIVLRNTAYSREQCSFAINPTTHFVMFRDDSKHGTSCVYGPDSTPFLPGRSRKVVVRHELNTRIGMGGEKGQHIAFQVVWAHKPLEARQMVEARNVKALAMNPRFARTDSDEIETTVPTAPLATMHPELPEKPTTRWAKIDVLGEGAFGEVHLAVDIDSGMLIAVKTIKKRQNQRKEDFFRLLEREIGALGRIEHPFVVEYIGYDASEDTPAAHVVMGLMDGSLHSLLVEKSLPPEELDSIASLMLTHMLQALDCVASMGIIHRDVKPENILYIQNPSGSRELIFKLGDFGLCNQTATAQSRAGTPAYMAPEISSGLPGQGQTAKADVWSLLMALIWTYDFKGFRHNANTNKFTVEALVQLAKEAVAPGQGLHKLAAMARSDPDRRASAAQMMVRLGLFAQEPRAILCSHGKDPNKIPAMAADDPPPPHPPPSSLQPTGPHPTGHMQPGG